MAEEEITRLLLAWRSGDEGAAERLFPLIYDHMRQLARVQLRGSRPGQTLDSRVLVHEAYLKLDGAGRWEVRDRRHFLALAGRVMRQIAVDHARSRLRQKRGAGRGAAPLDEVEVVDGQPTAEQTLELDRSLDRLSALDARLASVVELRYFAGLDVEETAQALDISPATVKRDWRRARAFLLQELRGGGLRREA